MSGMFSEEFRRNLKRIEEAFPEDKLLSKRQMADYLGFNDTRSLDQFDINEKLTRESFAARLSERRERGTGR